MKYNELMKLSDEMGFPDDMLLGFLIGSLFYCCMCLFYGWDYLFSVNFIFELECLNGVDLTEIEYFHSHFERLADFTNENLKKQVSLSYNLETNNLVNINSGPDDPTR